MIRATHDRMVHVHSVDVRNLSSQLTFATVVCDSLISHIIQMLIKTGRVPLNRKKSWMIISRRKKKLFLNNYKLCIFLPPASSSSIASYFVQQKPTTNRQNRF